MLAFAWILLAATTGGELVDGIYQVPANDWKFVPVELHQEPARISASYDVLAGSGNVRLALMLREDLERMREDLPGHIALTRPGRSGHLSDWARRRGDFVLVLDNRDESRPARVRLRVWLSFGAGPGPDVTELSPQRQLTIVSISFAVFFGIVTYSARRLWRAVKR